MTEQNDQYASIADLYDEVVLYADRPDIDFFVEMARSSGGPVLELGSGTGRVLLPTARAGIAIVGVDSSPSMLRICRERIGREPDSVRSKIELIQGDMRHFELGRTFPLVTMPFRPFQHLTTVPDQLACLAAVHRHLTPHGRLVFDLFNPMLEALVQDNLGAEFGEEPEFITADGRRVVRRHRFIARDRFKQVNSVELIYYVTHSDGRKERLVHGFDMRYCFRFEAEHLLVRAGFEVEAVYADYDRSPFGSKYPGELIFVAKKHPTSS